MAHEAIDTNTAEERLQRAAQMPIQVLLHLQVHPAVDALPLPAWVMRHSEALCDPLCDTTRCHIQVA